MSDLGLVGILSANEMLLLEKSVEEARKVAQSDRSSNGFNAWRIASYTLLKACATRRSFGLPDMPEIRKSLASNMWERCPTCGYEPMTGRDGFHSCRDRIIARTTIQSLRLDVTLPEEQAGD